MPSVPRPPQPAPAPAPVIPKPVAPASIAPPSAPPPVGQKEGYSAELRTMSADIGNIKVGQSPSGIRQATPSAPAAPALPTPAAPSAPVAAPRAPAAPAIVVPTTSGGSSRKFIYLTVGAVVLIGITYALVSMIGGSGSTSTPTPSPSESSTPAPTLGGKSLRSYFGDTKATIALPASASAQEFADKILDIQPQGGLASPVTVTLDGTDRGAIGALRIVSKSIADGLNSIVGTDQIALLYGQKEHFTSTGTPDTSQPVSTAAIFIFELKDASAATQFIGTIPTLSPKSSCTGLNSATYRQIAIQYRNCPFADSSEDYAVVLAGNQKNYLIISESRESMFFAIDQLMQ